MRDVTLPANLERLVRQPNARDDKYSRGVVGFITGSEAYPGAAVLGTAASLNCSIGLVRYVGPKRVQDLVLTEHPEVVCRERFADAGRANAWVIGSGVDESATEQASSIAALLSVAATDLPIVVDAGALDLIDFAQAKSLRLLLTPHAGELAKLLNRIEETSANTAETVTEGSFLVAGQAAKLTGQAILLKGSRSVLALPNGDCRIVGPNSAQLATAGSGDILAGIIGALAAANAADKKFNWLDVGELAVVLHSAAAELAAENSAANATDILEGLGALTSRMLAG